MLHDTFDKVNNYRGRIETMLIILKALSVRMAEYTNTSLRPSVNFPLEFKGRRLKIHSAASTMYYCDGSKDLRIPIAIIEIGADACVNLDQLFEVIAHLDEELSLIFNQIKKVFTDEAEKVVEEFHLTAVQDLL